jgi:hypothetical protein
MSPKIKEEAHQNIFLLKINSFLLSSHLLFYFHSLAIKNQPMMDENKENVIIKKK